MGRRPLAGGQAPKRCAEGGVGGLWLTFGWAAEGGAWPHARQASQGTDRDGALRPLPLPRRFRSTLPKQGSPGR